MKPLALLLSLAVPTVAWAQSPIPPSVSAPVPIAQINAPQVEVTIDQVLAGIQGFYAEAKDLKANFTQTYTYEVYGRSQVSEGVVYFKKPGRMRWDYKTPRPKVFVADGKTLWVYEPAESQVFKRSLAKAQLPVALTFMSGEGRLTDEFKAKLLKSKTPDTYLVELVPKRHAGDYQALRLTVDRATFVVQASTVVDPVGNTNRLQFRDIKTNVNLPDAGFAFTPPPGVKVITEPGH